MKILKISAAILSLAGGLTLASSAFAAPAEATASVNVRTGPSTSYRVVDTLRPGENVDVSRCAGGWCRIDHSGPDGWVSANYLTVYDRGRPVYDRNRDRRPTTRRDTSPDIGFCIDTPNVRFGINCTPTRPRVDRTPRQTAQVCFYENFNYRGASFCAKPGASDRSLSKNWNDRISSIRVRGNATATVCRDFGYRGSCATVNKSISRIGGRNNDVISSYRVR